MDNPRTLKDVISECLNNDDEVGMKAVYRESMRQLAEQRANKDGASHYKSMDIEPWDIIDTWPIEQQIGYHRGNILKYTMRMGTKDERLKEAKKAKHYAEKLAEVLEKP